MSIKKYPKTKYPLDYKSLIDKEISADKIIGYRQAGTTLTAEVSAEAHNEQEATWTIDKSVTPDQWNLFEGDTGTSKYTISVTKTLGSDEAFIDGVVTVTNGGAEATENLSITVVLTMPPSQDPINSINVDVSSNPVLDPGSPGETGTYAYSISIPEGDITPGAEYKVTANVTITNHSGHLGEPFGPTPSATDTLPEVTIVNDTIHVTDDDNIVSQPFSDSGETSYFKTFSCPDNEGTNDNTAVIDETGQSASATVTVNCYELEVSKDANTSLTREFDWSITKSADQSDVTLEIGQSIMVNYTITVDQTSSDSGFAVTGTVTVHNPAPIPATINSINDIIQPGDIPVSLDFGVTFPFVLAAGDTLTSAYSSTLPDATERTNIATATLQNFDYNFDGSSTESGTTDFTGTADIDFSNATVNNVNQCVNIEDTFKGPLGRVCAEDTPVTFTYTRQIGPFETCGDREIVNTANVVADDFTVLASASFTVIVHVPCRGLIIGEVI